MVTSIAESAGTGVIAEQTTADVARTEGATPRVKEVPLLTAETAGGVGAQPATSDGTGADVACPTVEVVASRTAQTVSGVEARYTTSQIGSQAADTV